MGGLSKSFALLLAIAILSPLIMVQPETTKADSNSDDWPMFQHDLTHTGYSPAHVSDKPDVLWTAPKGLGGSPIIANGSVFVLDLGHLYCFDLTNGKQVWNKSVGGGMPDCSPAIYSNNIYTPLGAYNAQTGAMVLNYSNYRGYSSPTISDGIIFFGSHFNKGLFALNVNTGDKIWNYTTGGAVDSSPAVANGRVYFQSNDGYLYSINALTGSKIWSFKMNEPSNYMQSSPAIVGQDLFISGKNQIYCINAITGNKLWNFSETDSSMSSPAIANGVVYVVGFGTKIWALNASTGAQIWCNPSDGSGCSPAVADGVVYIGGSWRIAAINASTGTKIWNFSFPPSEYYMDSSPAIVNGYVFASSGSGLYAFGDPAIVSSPTNFNFVLGFILAVPILSAAVIILFLLWRKKKPETRLTNAEWLV
jgi:outer membrane protein assembly factor BamB